MEVIGVFADSHGDVTEQEEFGNEAITSSL